MAKLKCGFITELIMGDSVGVEYLLAILRTNNYEVNLLLDEGGFKPWENHQSILVEFNAIFNFIEKHSIQVLFVSTSTDYCQRALVIAKGVKKKYQNIIICFGGPHATYSHEYLVEQSCIDYVCRGEGDIAIIELLKYLEGDRSDLPDGIYTRKNGEVVGKGFGELVKNLDDLPFPDKSDYYKQVPFVRNIYSIVLSRGCFNKCTYCNSSVFKGYYKSVGQVPLRRRSVNNAIEELKLAKKIYKPQLVVFNDDTFIFNKKYMLEFATHYKEEIGIPFTCSSQPNYHDAETLDLLAKAGLVNVEVGVQSLDDEIRRTIFGRGESFEDIQKYIRMLRERSVYVYTDHILNPWENEKKLKEQLFRYNDIRPDWISVFYLYYYPSVPIIERALKDGIIKSEDLVGIKQGKVEKNFFYGGHLSKKMLLRHKSYILFLTFLPIMPQFVARVFLLTGLHHLFFLMPKYVIFIVRGINALVNANDTWGRLNLKHLIYDTFKLHKSETPERILEIANISRGTYKLGAKAVLG